MRDPLVALAAHVEANPFFLAQTLALYARSEELDDAALAARLGCTALQLPHVRLCRTPRPDPVEFREDITVIAGHYGIDEQVLAEVVKRAWVIRKLQQAPAGPGLLMAARDREQPAGPAPEAP
jgi:hypothetical protein